MEYYTNYLCKNTEINNFPCLKGFLNFFGHGVLPHASYAAINIQQFTADKSRRLGNRNNFLSYIISLNPFIKLKPIPTSSATCYLALSDTGTGTTYYGHTGLISGLFLPAGVRFCSTPPAGVARIISGFISHKSERRFFKQQSTPPMYRLWLKEFRHNKQFGKETPIPPDPVLLRLLINDNHLERRFRLSSPISSITIDGFSRNWRDKHDKMDSRDY